MVGQLPQWQPRGVGNRPGGLRRGDDLPARAERVIEARG